MKKSLFLIFLFFITHSVAHAQTWNGSVSNVWTNPLNWTPNTVPNNSSIISLVPAPNNPKLQANTSIGGILGGNGSTLDFNGFSLTMTGANGYNNITGTTFINSNVSTDIILNLNLTNNGYDFKFNGNTVNDHITINLSGSDTYYEGAGGLNTFNGNVTYLINGPLETRLCDGTATQYNGNFTFTRNIAGTTNLFVSSGYVGGNFTYQNLFGGATSIGNSLIMSTILGTFSMNASYVTPSSFALLRMKNQITGGIINVQGPQGFNVRNDSLKVTSFTIQGYQGNAYTTLFNSRIEGNLFLEDHISYSTGYDTDLRNNTFIGNTTITLKGSNQFNEANAGAGSANVFTGNTLLNCNGSGAVYLSHSDKSIFNGNLTLNRTIAGYTRIFNSGATISGNFSYTNIASGDNDLGNLISSTTVGGTVNMNVNLALIGRFEMYRIVNQTAGGKINVHNSRGFDIRNDSLKVDSLNVISYRGSAYAYFYNNRIDGHLQLADSVSYGGGYNTEIRNSTINGNTQLKMYGANSLEEASTTGVNTFNGNLIISIFGTGTLYTSYQSKSIINGNCIVNRTGAGYTRLFAKGANIGGSFSYTKNSAGASDIGILNSKTSIGGTINLNVTQTTNDNFSMYRIQNFTNGGSILVQNTKAPNIQQDTLLCSAISLLGYGGSAYCYLYDNKLNGQFAISDIASYGGGYNTELRNNEFNGNCTISILGTNTFTEASTSLAPNVFNGNVDFNVSNSASLYISHDAKSTYNGNLTINRTAGGFTKAFNFGATVNGNLTFTKNASGASEFGHVSRKTAVSGTVNMNITQSTTDMFEMLWLVNNTFGGSISIQDIRGFNVQKDSLKINGLSLTNYGNNAYSYLHDNQIEGGLTIADNANFSGGYNTSLENNTIFGNASITNNGFNILNDGNSSGGGSTYLGNVIYTRNGGIMNIGTVDTNSYAGNLTFNNAVALPINSELIKFIGSTNTAIDQLGTGTINIQKMIVNKISSAKITLNKPVTISTSCAFLTGYINSTSTNSLIFPDNINHNSASNNSHVIGCVTKAGNDIFTFPLGNGIGYHPLAITAPATTTDTFQACIILKHPSDDGYNVSSKDVALLQIAPYHYWTLNQIAGTNTETVSLGWSIPCANTVVASLPGMAVARWNGTQWNNLGNSATSGTATLGSVTQTGTTSNYGIFALATTNASNSWQITTVSASSSTICAGTSTTLTASGATTYNWQPGNLSGTSVVVVPLTTTTYTITGTSSTGCITTATRLITVNPLPNISTTATATTLCSGSSTTITASNANTYTWNPGSLTGASITVSPTSTTTYTVTGTTTATGCTKTATRLITVNPLPNVSTTATATTLCSGSSTTITASNANTYTWNPGSLTGTSITVSPTSTTTYTVTGTTTATGCTKTATRTITVNPLPNVSTTATATTLCSGSSTTITASNANTYTWNPGGLTGTSITVSPTSTTTYTVTGTTTSTGCTKTATRTVTVNNCVSNLTVKLFIQGYYNGGGFMKNVLFNQGALPTITGQCDNINLNLHYTTPPYALASTVLAPLQTNGNATASYVNLTGQSYYLVLKHRTGIETWSANPVTFTTGSMNYDFTNAASKAFGSNQVSVGSGVFAFYSGDIDQNGSIEAGDYSLWEFDSNNFEVGFLATDLDGDGSVGTSDYSIWEANANGFVGVVTP